MINMLFSDDKKEFIRDIRIENDEIVLLMGDGSIKKEKFTVHNLQFYRLKMIQQAEDYLPNFLNRLSDESLKITIKKYLFIIGGIASMYLLYNIDIHIIMKIILSIIIILGEIGHFIYSECLLDILGNGVIEAFATKKYLECKNNFSYFDTKDGEEKFILPPEFIERFGLTEDDIIKADSQIEEFRKNGKSLNELKMVFVKRSKLE